MKATDTHMAILASNLIGAIASVATEQPWWLSAISVIAGTITCLAFQGTGAIARDALGTGRIAAGEFLIMASTIATGHMASAPVGAIVRICFFVTQMAAIGTFIDRTEPIEPTKPANETNDPNHEPN